MKAPLIFLSAFNLLFHSYTYSIPATIDLDSLTILLTNARDDVIRMKLYLSIGNRYLKMMKFEEAAGYAGKCLEIAKKKNDYSHIAGSFYLIGYYFYHQEKYSESIKFFSLSRDYYIKISDTQGAGLCYNRLGDASWYKGDYANASRNYLDALKYAELLKDTEAIANCNRNIGWVYFAQKNYKSALEYFHKTLEMYKKLNITDEFSAAYSDIGIVYQEQNEYRKAIQYHLQALKIAEQLNDSVASATGYANLAINFEGLSDYDNAEKYLWKSIEISGNQGNLIHLAICYNNMGDIKRKQKKYHEALGYQEKALSISRQIEFLEGIKYAYESYALTHEAMGNYKVAYDFYKKYAITKDSLLNEETSRQMAEMHAKFESEKKEKEITILKKDKEIQKSEVGRQKIMRNSFVGAAVLGLLLALLLYNRYRIKQHANIRLSEQNEQIRRQKELIEEQKQNITDSIEYASNIQKAMLPTDEEFYRLFPEAFILYKPRDIVSGDFYWCTGISSPLEKGVRGIDKDILNPPSPPFSKGEIPAITNVHQAMLACCDCTGHGVPGAFMSMLCNALLNEAVNDKGLTKPNEIFEEVRKGIIAALKQRTGQTGNTKDGMDATIISFNGLSLQSACANNPVYIVSNHSLTEVPPDRFPIGVPAGEQKSFTCHEMTVKKGDMIYTITDGFEDQLGGAKGKKFKSAKLKELLLEIAPKPVFEQKEILNKAFKEWRGTGEQTDDVTLIGIRISQY